jgi:hypothetical protein
MTHYSKRSRADPHSVRLLIGRLISARDVKIAGFSLVRSSMCAIRAARGRLKVVSSHALIIFHLPRSPIRDPASDATKLRAAFEGGAACAGRDRLRLLGKDVRSPYIFLRVARPKRIGDGAETGDHLSEREMVVRSFLARDELLENSARRLLETHPAHAPPDARDALAVEQIGDVLARVAIVIESGRAQRDGDGAFCSADQVERPGDLDAPPAKCWIDRPRFEVETSAARYG